MVSGFVSRLTCESGHKPLQVIACFMRHAGLWELHAADKTSSWQHGVQFPALMMWQGPTVLPGTEGSSISPLLGVLP